MGGIEDFPRKILNIENPGNARKAIHCALIMTLECPQLRRYSAPRQEHGSFKAWKKVAKKFAILAFNVFIQKTCSAKFVCN